MAIQLRKNDHTSWIKEVNILNNLLNAATKHYQIMISYTYNYTSNDCQSNNVDLSAYMKEFTCYNEYCKMFKFEQNLISIDVFP